MIATETLAALLGRLESEPANRDLRGVVADALEECGRAEEAGAVRAGTAWIVDGGAIEDLREEVGEAAETWPDYPEDGLADLARRAKRLALDAERAGIEEGVSYGAAQSSYGCDWTWDDRAEVPTARVYHCDGTTIERLEWDACEVVEVEFSHAGHGPDRCPWVEPVGWEPEFPEGYNVGYYLHEGTVYDRDDDEAAGLIYRGRLDWQSLCEHEGYPVPGGATVPVSTLYWAQSGFDQWADLGTVKVASREG